MLGDRALTLREWPPRRLGGPRLQLLLLPLFREGSFNGMLIIPTKSSVGTRERRIDLIRMASPFPVWISCKAGSEEDQEGPLTPPPPASRALATKGFSARAGHASQFP